MTLSNHKQGVHTCALWCWGGNSSGDLGTGNTSDTSTPVQAGTGTSWAAVSASLDYTCAVRTDRTLWCWGYNFYGQLGNGLSAALPTPQPVR